MLSDNNMKLQDRLWVWGQETGSHHLVPQFNLPGVNRMGTVDFCREFGVPNCCRVAVPAGPFPPFDNASAELAGLREVVWSAVGACGVTRNDNDGSDLDEVIRQAEMFPNISGAVLDDFFAAPETLAAGGPMVRHSLASLQAMREKLHNFPVRKLDLWLVWYDYQLDYPVTEFADCCDVISFWTWEAKNLVNMEENLQKVRLLVPGKRYFAGVYLWDYGTGNPLPDGEMTRQLEIARKFIHDGLLEGIIVCSNCVADLGLTAADELKEWIKIHGDEKV